MDKNKHQEKQNHSKETEKPETEAKEISVDDLIDKLAELQQQLAEQKTAVEEQKKAVQSESKKAQEMMHAASQYKTDFENYKKRTDETNKTVRSEGRADVIVKLLPLADVINQALSMIPDPKVAEGVKMIDDQLKKILNGLGVTEVESEGKPFDPKVHEAIMQDGESENGIQTVKAVLQPGYFLGEKLLRPARVIVTK